MPLVIKFWITKINYLKYVFRIYKKKFFILFKIELLLELIFLITFILTFINDHVQISCKFKLM